MKAFSIICIVLAIGVLLPSAGVAQQFQRRNIQRFDKDGDGKLSKEERAAALKQLSKLRKTPEHLVEREWTIDGLKRTALLAIPKEAKNKPTPVVFGFHGHGGSAVNAARSFHFEKHWPEAIVVYMQGVPTPGVLSDPKGERNGWQHQAGNQGDRDLKFFDAVLGSLKADYKVDSDRIYCSGHSNGGAMTYLLWAERPDVFAATAPSGAPATKAVRKLNAKPAMHIAGENDPLVKYVWQDATIKAVRKLNECEETGTEWAKDCTIYQSKSGTPFVTMITNQGHRFPQEAPALIVKFFKLHAKSTKTKQDSATLSR